MSTAQATSKIEPQEVTKRFQNPVQTQVTGMGKTQYEAIHDQLQQLAMEMVQTLPPGRETSLAVEKIEEAQHWAFKSFQVQQIGR